MINSFEKALAGIVIGGMLFLIACCVTYYYPTEEKIVTIEKSVHDTNSYAVLTTDGEYYEITFRIYTIIDPGKTYLATISHPWLKYPNMLDVDEIRDED
jgi:hypothetical protein